MSTKITIGISTLIAATAVIAVTIVGILFARNIVSVDKTLSEKHNLETTTRVVAGLASAVCSGDVNTDEFLKTLEGVRLFKDPTVHFFVLDNNGRLIADGRTPVQDGGADPSETDLARQLVRVALEDGGGFVRYKWLNSATKKKDYKTTFVIAIPGTSWILGAGFYQ